MVAEGKPNYSRNTSAGGEGITSDRGTEIRCYLSTSHKPRAAVGHRLSTELRPVKTHKVLSGVVVPMATFPVVDDWKMVELPNR